MLSPVEQPKTHKGMWFDGQPQGLGHAYLTPAHCCGKTGQYMNDNMATLIMAACWRVSTLITWRI
jgi:hypothetical protein